MEVGLDGEVGAHVPVIMLLVLELGPDLDRVTTLLRLVAAGKLTLTSSRFNRTFWAT